MLGLGIGFGYGGQTVVSFALAIEAAAKMANPSALERRFMVELGKC